MTKVIAYKLMYKTKMLNIYFLTGDNYRVHLSRKIHF